MQFRYLGEITIRPASILGIIYETFASVPSAFKGSTRGKTLRTERITMYSE
jgi:hypothetical protein